MHLPWLSEQLSGVPIAVFVWAKLGAHDGLTWARAEHQMTGSLRTGVSAANCGFDMSKGGRAELPLVNIHLHRDR